MIAPDCPCHFVRRRAQALEQYLAGGYNAGAVVKQVTNGKGAMPAFGGRLSDEDIANVAAYVISTSSAGWEGGEGSGSSSLTSQMKAR